VVPVVAWKHDGSELADTHPSQADTPTKGKAYYKYRHVWRRALVKLTLRRTMNQLNNDIIIYGTSNEVIDVGSYEEIMKAKEFKAKSTIFRPKIPWYILSPKSAYLYGWNIIVAVLLVYTATYMPYRIAFEDPVYFDAMTTFELVMDMLFIKDILVNCVTTYTNDKGQLEASIQVIIVTYLKSWFVIDLISSFPMGLLEFSLGLDTGTSPKANRFARLARLPRLYKLVRILRITKLSRIYKGSPIYEKLEDWLDINGRFLKLSKFLLSIALIVHFLACFFFFAAKMEGMSPDTWVYKMGYQDWSNGKLYLASFYWAFTTISTVGYGDIHAFTEVEMIVSIIAEAVGVGIYSMIISSMTSLLSSIDVREAEIANKVKAAEDFGVEAGLNRETINKIRQVIKYKASVFSVDNLKILEEMPKTLKTEVVLQMYNGIANTMPLFQKRDSSFVVFVLPRLVPLYLDQDDEVYEENDAAEDIFVITKGRVHLTLTARKVDFKGFLKGTHFGEVEILANCKRIDSALALSIVELLTMSKAQFEEMLNEFPAERFRIQEMAIERLKRNHAAKIVAMNAMDLPEEEIQGESCKHYKLLMAFETPEKLAVADQSLLRMKTLDCELREGMHTLETELKDLKQVALGSRPI
jgi:hyperpolarization activated cyclic nucleotide-gated potassium channel 1